MVARQEFSLFLIDVIHSNNLDNNKDENRLVDIDRRLDKIQSERLEKNSLPKSALPSGTAAIIGRVATELVAGICVGTFFGWGLDEWLGTSPLFLLVMFFFGAIAGMLNVWRVYTGRGLSAGYFEEYKKESKVTTRGVEKK